MHLFCFVYSYVYIIENLNSQMQIIFITKIILIVAVASKN